MSVTTAEDRHQRSHPPADPPAAPGPIFRLGRATARHPWRTITAWIALAVLIGALSSSFGQPTQDTYVIPGTDSSVANELLTDRFPEESGATARVVFQDPEGVARHAEAIDAAITEILGLPHVIGSTDPLDPTTGGFVNDDGTIAVATVAYDEPVTHVEPEVATEGLDAAVEPVRAAGATVELGGEVPENTVPEQSGAELIGLLVAAVVLAVAFRSLLAMGMPIVIALASLAIGMSGIGLLAARMQVSTITPMIAAMVGLGVGIDYALFVVTRHREELARGASVPDAAGMATATAGKAVLFAGGTVVVAICGLWFVGVPLLASIGFGTAIVVTVCVAAALTLLPALMGLAGERLSRTRFRRRARVERAPLSSRWAAHVGLHPVRYAVLSLFTLLLLAAPVLSLRMGWADAGSEPTSATHRRAYDLVAEGFGAGANGPLLVTVDLGDDMAARDAVPLVGALAGELTHTVGVDRVIPARFNETRDTAVLVVMPTTGPEEEATTDLVGRIRADALPSVLDGTDATGHVTGATAALVDLSARLADRMALFIGAVVFVSFLLLVVLFRSLLVPLKAALMNLLSIGAAYGVLVAVFQWGWGASLFGLDGPVPITAFIPVMVFAIVFGLSMDYEVFLLSRVREEFDRTGDPHQSVVDGLGATARVITSAALVMIAVFVAFGMAPNTAVKMMGIGLATAVLVDATVIRMVLVPASMAILGRANWWLPAWLDRRLPHLGLEGPAPAPRAPAPVGAGDLVIDLAATERTLEPEPVGAP